MERKTRTLNLPCPLNAEFAMRTKAYEFENVIALLAINQHHIRFNVAVPVPFQFSLQGVVNVTCWQGHISYQQIHCSFQQRVNIPIW